MQYNPNPPPFRNNDETFKTTYGTAYRDVPTYQVSPVYENVHNKNAGRRPMVGPPPIGPSTDRDLSPYLYTRDLSPIPIKDRKPYQPKHPSQRDQENYDNRHGFQRSRFDDATLKRDEYQEPLPNRDSYIEREQRMSPVQLSPRRHEQRHAGPPPQSRDRYRDMLANPERASDDLPQTSFCNKCMEPNVCVNGLGCNHRYCDNCMSALRGTNGPFRDAMVFFYQCGICNGMTSENKVVRFDNKGRRLLKYSDVSYYDNNNP